MNENKKKKIEEKKEKDNTRRSFLLTFFNQEIEHYEEKEINNYWLIKQWNGDTKRWQVAIYTKESYNNYKQYQKLGN